MKAQLAARADSTAKRHRIWVKLLAIAMVAQGLAFTSAATSQAADAPTLEMSTTTVARGGTITLTGTGWKTADNSSGSTIAIKIDRGAYAHLSGEPGEDLTVWQIINVGTDGNFVADLNLPDGTTAGALGSNPPFPEGAHILNFLTGSLKAGDEIRSIPKDITVSDATLPSNAVTMTPATLTPGTAFRLDINGTFNTTDNHVEISAGSTPLTGTVTNTATGLRVADLQLPTSTAYGAGSLAVNVLDSSNAVVGTASVNYLLRHNAVFQLTPNPVAPGAVLTIKVTGLAANATVSKVTIADRVLPGSFNVDGSGELVISTELPATEALGAKTITVSQSAPYASDFTGTVNVERSVAGTDGFNASEAALIPGLYQSAYGAFSKSLFVTAAVGRPPVEDTAILRLNPDTLRVVTQTTPGEVTGGSGRYAAYGVGVDDEHGTVWITESRTNTIAVYTQHYLSLVKRYPAGSLSHGRDVIVDETRHRAYASAARSDYIAVFDTDTLDQLPSISLAAAGVSPMSLALDEATGTLFTVSLDTAKAAVIDVSDTSVPAQIRTIDLGGNAVQASGVAYDPVNELLFVASQTTNNVLIIDTYTGQVVKDVPTGSGALNVTWDPIHSVAYVVNRVGGNTTAITAEGKVVASLDTGKNSNHASTDGKGNVFVVNKGGDREGVSNDLIVKISAKSDYRKAFKKAATPTISGTAKVGSKLTAKAGTWSPKATSYRYQWLRGGVAIPGATASTYVLTAEDAGKAITVKAKGLLSGYANTWSKVSKATKKVAAGTLTTKTPVLVNSSGKVPTKTAPVFEDILSVNNGAWGPGVDLVFSYQWLRSGKKITGETGATYQVTASDIGKTIAVKVTGAKPGYKAVTKTAKASKKVVAKALTATPVPTITGTPTVGEVLTADPGVWDPAPVGLSYQWLRNGKAIKGQTNASYTTTNSDKNKSISVKVTGKKSGYKSVSKTSAKLKVTA
jgi:DNA-binding beta-propeller fold protein YncE